MTTVKEYRHFAEECLSWARDARSEEERKAFLDMARTWTQAAVCEDAARVAGRPEPSQDASKH